MDAESWRRKHFPAIVAGRQRLAIVVARVPQLLLPAGLAWHASRKFAHDVTLRIVNGHGDPSRLAELVKDGERLTLGNRFLRRHTTAFVETPADVPSAEARWESPPAATTPRTVAPIARLMISLSTPIIVVIKRTPHTVLTGTVSAVCRFRHGNMHCDAAPCRAGRRPADVGLAVPP